MIRNKWFQQYVQFLLAVGLWSYAWETVYGSWFKCVGFGVVLTCYAVSNWFEGRYCK